MNQEINQHNADDQREGLWEQVMPYFDNLESSNKKGLCRGFYKNGLRDGLWSWYTSKGNIYREKNFKEGIFSGKTISWHKNTNILQFTGQYREDGSGLRCGDWIWYFKDGTIQQITKFNDDNSDCFAQQYNKSGDLILEKIYIS